MQNFRSKDAIGVYTLKSTLPAPFYPQRQPMMKPTIYFWMVVLLLAGRGWNLGRGAAQGTLFTYLPLAMESPAIMPSNITAAGNGASYAPQSSADGSVVAFLSDANNLVAGDTNGFADAFVWERDTGLFRRASLASDGTEGDGSTSRVWLSGNGRYVLFISTSSNLVVGDTNGTGDLFRHDLWNGVTELVSVTPTGVAAGAVESAAITEEGNTILFTSAVAMTADPMPATCVQEPCTALFRREMATGETTAVLSETDGTLTTPIREVFSSADGTIIVYARVEIAGSGCIPDYGCSTQYGQFIWRRDKATQDATLIARSEYQDWGHAYLNAYVQLRGLSADGNTIAYWSHREGGSGSGGNSSAGLLVKQGSAEATALYSITFWTYPRSQNGGFVLIDPQFSASADGEVLIFNAHDLNGENNYPQFPDDTNGYKDLFRVRGGQYLRLNNPITTHTANPSLSADGHTLYFESVGMAILDPNRRDIFISTLP